MLRFALEPSRPVDARRGDPLWRRVVFWLVVSAAGASCGTPAEAQLNRYWIAPAGGGWDGSTNWSATAGGAGGASEPGVNDFAYFTLNNVYTVTGANGDFIRTLNVQNGNVTFDLGGGTLVANDTLAAVVVGGVAGQTARMTIANGTLAADTAFDGIDVGVGGTGHLTVTTGGVLGTAAARPVLRLGGGSLTVNSNGSVELSTLSTTQASTSAVVNVTGSQAVLRTNATTWIGTSGTGSLAVSGGGTATTGSDALVGSASTAIGAAAISGAGSRWTVAGVTTVGNLGAGSLTVSGGGHFSTGGNLNLGLAAGSRGELSVTGAGSRISVGGNTVIGSAGVGEATVSASGSVASGAVTLGAGVFPSRGRLQITGSGSQWVSTGALTLGGSTGGSGAVEVLNGGKLSADSISLGSISVGSMLVDGDGSLLSISGNVNLASIGSSGDLTIRNGGIAAIGGNVSVGNLVSALIDGGSAYIAGALTAATGALDFSDGLLQVRGAFQPRSTAGPFVVDGLDVGDLPTVDLVGAAAVTNITTLTVGSARRGALVVREGRELDLAGNPLNIGALAGGHGEVTLGPGGSLVTAAAGSLNLGGAGGTAGGTGVLNIAPGGSVDVGTLHVHPGGVLNLDGGMLAFDALGPLAGQLNWTAGTVRFDAAITSLTSTLAATFLGADRTLRAGRSLTSSQELSLATHAAVDGGTFAATTLSLSSSGLLEVRSGLVESSGVVDNTGTVALAGSLATVRGTTFNNTGILRGSGLVRAALNNTTSGAVQVTENQRLEVIGASHVNSGHVSIIGGEFQATGPLVNAASTGLVSVRNGVARFQGGLTNNGALGVTFGTSDIFGDVTNSATGQINVSGGASVTFYDDVIQNGTMVITAIGPQRSTAVFFGALSGAGGYVGGGDLYAFGDLRPGASPGSVTMGGNLFLGATATTQIELEGLSVGQFDQLVVTGDLTLGGTLSVESAPNLLAPGQHYLIADVAGQRSGQFNGLGEGALVGEFNGVNLYITYAAGDGNDVALFTKPVFSADFNDDGKVDGMDLVLWNDGFGSANASHGDANGDAVVDGTDFLEWQRQFGGGLASAATANVPEPASMQMIVLAVAAVLVRRLSSPL
ncbi:MAG: hypothetical protein KF847_20860 [Pirellulales bacterium]|nr:hypothetical protein [Pirellulales bacterium]